MLAKQAFRGMPSELRDASKSFDRNIAPMYQLLRFMLSYQTIVLNKVVQPSELSMRDDDENTKCGISVLRRIWSLRHPIPYLGLPKSL